MILLDFLKGDKGDPGAQGQPGATFLGMVTLTETAIVAITAGIRRVTIATDPAWGVVVGTPLVVIPTSLPSASYATHDVIATGANQIQVGLSCPLIGIGQSYSIPCRLIRVNI